MTNIPRQTYLRLSISFCSLFFGAEYSPGAGVAVQCSVISYWWCVKKKQLSLSFSGGGVRCSRGALKNKQRNFKLGPRLQPAQTFLICSLCPFTIIEQHFPCRRIICQRYSTSFCAKIRVEDSVCCWHFKSLSLISPLASLRRNKCSLHASFIFHAVILHVKIRAVIKYNIQLCAFWTPFADIALKKEFWCFGTKRNLLFLEEKSSSLATTKSTTFVKEYSLARVTSVKSPKQK